MARNVTPVLTSPQRVGGKNASVGELLAALWPKEVGVLDGFATTTDAYWRLPDEQGLRLQLEQIVADLDPENLRDLPGKGQECRTRILDLRNSRSNGTWYCVGSIRSIGTIFVRPAIARDYAESSTWVFLENVAERDWIG